jgi:hypothetical protein
MRWPHPSEFLITDVRSFVRSTRNCEQDHTQCLQKNRREKNTFQMTSFQIITTCPIKLVSIAKKKIGNWHFDLARPRFNKYNFLWKCLELL